MEARNLISDRGWSGIPVSPDRPLLQLRMRIAEVDGTSRPCVWLWWLPTIISVLLLHPEDWSVDSQNAYGPPCR
jgi:hypothetical protein